MQQNPFEAFRHTGSTQAEFADEQFQAAVHAHASSPLFASLSKVEQGQALKRASELNIAVYEHVLDFGMHAQQALRNFTQQMAVYVERKSSNKVGEVLSQLITHLEEIDPDALLEREKGFFQKIFSRPKQSVHQVLSHYKRMSVQIDRLAIQLEHSQIQLLRDFQQLEQLYDLNEQYFQEINVYIAAGEMKKTDAQTKLPAVSADDLLSTQKRSDAEMALEWLDRRLYDLQISREIAIQAAPQIRLMQQTNQQLIDKIQASIMTTIPMWQSQIATILTMNQQRKMVEAQERLANASAQMVRKNGRMKERASLSHEEIDRFKRTQLKLIDDIEEALRVQVAADEVAERIQA